MGLLFTLLYILTAYLGPYTVWGPLADLRIQLILALLAVIGSVPGMGRSRIGLIPQSYALMGMLLAVMLSMVTVQLGLVPLKAMDFFPCIFAFYMIAINFRKRWHLQALVLMLLVACVVTIGLGYYAIRTGNEMSPYLIAQGVSSGDTIYRLRGLAFINDPNDFSQVMVSLIPCLFFFWRKGNFLLNGMVLASTGVLVFGMFLTHSRGGMVALLAVILFAFRRKIGTIPAGVIAGVLAVGALAAGWSGGREISVESGEDRMEAWSTGIQLIKQHPLFGVGFQRFTEFYYITAHNTIVVCAAELGLFGLFWWVMFVLPTVRDAYVTSRGFPEEKISEEEEEAKLLYNPSYQRIEPKPVADLRWQPAGHPAESDVRGMADARSGEGAEYGRVGVPAAAGAPVGALEPEPEMLPVEEIRRIATLLTISLVGYFVAGWFLSRAYIMTLFIYGGMVQVVYRWALDQGIAPPRMPVNKIVQYSAICSIVLILIVYVMLRIQHLLPK